jgi:hypothetical protein
VRTVGDIRAGWHSAHRAIISWQQESDQSNQVARLHTLRKIQPVSTESTDATDQMVFAALKSKYSPFTRLSSGVYNIENEDCCVSHLV